MKILQINSVCGVTGTGRIVTNLYDAAQKQGHDCIIAYGEHKYQNHPGDRKTIEIGTMRDCNLHAAATRLWDAQGFASRRATEEFFGNTQTVGANAVYFRLYSISCFKFHEIQR